ncbi:MAG: DNA polymerase IV [Chloroflexia bacterium]
MIESQISLWRQPARRWVAHVDMDAFFASVEQQDDPHLRGRPVVVGNSPLTVERLRVLALEAQNLPRTPEYIRGVRGVVASASYEARVYGVRSAMPLAKALVLCPDAVVLAGRFDRYREVAEHLRRVWSEFSPLVEPASLDEAYLDMTGCELAGGPILEIGRCLKARILEETGLTASVGIGSSKLMAKIASDLEKPDGLVVVAHGDEARTLAPLPVRALPGIGPRAAEALLKLGVSTVGQLAIVEHKDLAQSFGEEHASGLIRRAHGIDDTPVQVAGDPKSISRETTLAEDESDMDILQAMIRTLSDQVAWSLRREGFCARCVYLKLRLLPRSRAWRLDNPGFGKLITRQHTLPALTDSGQEICEAVKKLLAAAADSTGLGKGSELVRLIGVGTTSLVAANHLRPMAVGSTDTLIDGSDGPLREGGHQLALTASEQEKDRRLTAGLDHIRERFGYEAIIPGISAKRQPTKAD